MLRDNGIHCCFVTSWKKEFYFQRFVKTLLCPYCPFGTMANANEIFRNEINWYKKSAILKQLHKVEK